MLEVHPCNELPNFLHSEIERNAHSLMNVGNCRTTQIFCVRVFVIDYVWFALVNLLTIGVRAKLGFS